LEELFKKQVDRSTFPIGFKFRVWDGGPEVCQNYFLHCYGIHFNSQARKVMMAVQRGERYVVVVVVVIVAVVGHLLVTR
jgi:hypothetical protein